MNILMIGDSWGVPNYLWGPLVDWGPEHHTEHLLRNLGYHVYNYSINSGSNLQTMGLVDFSHRHEGVNDCLVPIPNTGVADHLGRTLGTWMAPRGIPSSLPREVDWTIWFHTEVFRDGFDGNNYHNKSERTFQQCLEAKCHEVYSQAQEFFHRVGGKLAVIGGQAPIGPKVRDIFYSYIQPDFIIEDWRSEILGMDLECYTAMSVNGNEAWAIQGNDTVEEQERLVDIQEKTLGAMRDSTDFPDSAHPGCRPHANLTQRLHEVFQKLP